MVGTLNFVVVVVVVVVVDMYLVTS